MEAETLALAQGIDFSLWGLLGLVLGAMAGVFLWRALRNRGWMDVPWRGYKYVRWLWPVLMVGTLSLGLGSGLGVWGGGRAIKQGAGNKVKSPHRCPLPPRPAHDREPPSSAIG